MSVSCCSWSQTVAGDVFCLAYASHNNIKDHLVSTKHLSFSQVSMYLHISMYAVHMRLLLLASESQSTPPSPQKYVLINHLNQTQPTNLFTNLVFQILVGLVSCGQGATCHTLAVKYVFLSSLDYQHKKTKGESYILLIFLLC